MTIEEVVRELEAAQALAESPDGYHTTDELADACGVVPGTIHTRLKRIKKAGRLEVTTVVRSAIDGRPCKVPGYRVLPS